MTEPTRAARARRGNRGPGSLLLTALLVLAIVASSMLVFTNKVELLKLAVIVALWAAVVAAFVSFIYRRQSDMDQAKSRDLKLVYDLQLDREISARREYELAIESQLRRELASELRSETSDEVAALRAELAALRANLEIIFDTDLQSRPAIETERTTVHALGEWDGLGQGGAGQGMAAPDRGERSLAPGRVISSRIDTEAQDDFDPSTEESPIIDVPAEPQPPEVDGAAVDPGGAHRRASERQSADDGWRVAPQEPPQPDFREEEGRRRAPDSPPQPAPILEVRLPWMPPEAPAPAVPPTPPPPPPPRQEPDRLARHAPVESQWRPAPAEGQYIPAGRPGSNWTAPADTGASAPAAERAESTEHAESAERAETPAVEPQRAPVMNPPPTEEPRGGRHYPDETAASEFARRSRHSSDADPGRPASPPTLAVPPGMTSPPPPTEASEPESSRHRGADDVDESAGQHIGGQPLSELMARLEVGSTGSGRRRRRDE